MDTKKSVFNNCRVICLSIGLIVFLVFLLLFQLKALDNFEQITIKWRFNYFHSDSKPSNNCIILGINSQASKKFGRWPWSRKAHADILEALDFYGAKAVAFDIFFPEPNKYDLPGDLKFAENIKKMEEHGNNVIIATVVDAVRSKNYYSNSEYKKLMKLGLPAKNQLLAITPDDIYYYLTAAEKKEFTLVLQKPYNDLLNAINSIGLVNLVDKDTEAISIPLFVKYNSSYFPVLGLSTYLTSLDKPVISQGKGYITINKKKIPTFDENKFLINWYKPQDGKALPYNIIAVDSVVKAYEFLAKASKQTGMSKEEIQGKIDQLFECNTTGKCSKELKKFEKMFPADAEVIPSSFYKDKFIFIGVVDQSGGTKDLIRTPLSESIPGVFLHVNLFDNLVQNDFITKLPPFVTIIIMLILVFATVITVARLRDPKLSILVGLIYLCYALIPLWLFKKAGIYMDMTYTECAIFTACIFSICYQWWLVDQDKQEIKNIFSNYLAPQILNEVLSDPSKVNLGGNRREISILFSDIRGFTSISEVSTPEEVVQFLNEYFDAMVDEVIKTEGTIDKFIGDAIMAFWGAPVEHKDHAELAVRCAINMSYKLEELKKKWKEQGKTYPEINIGIGINSGDALVGHVGSSKIKSYTVIGDSVNLASRLEGPITAES